MNYIGLIGYILYGILILITVAWMYGVRAKKTLCGTVLMSLAFLILLLVFTFSGINKIWIALGIPAIYATVIVYPFVFAHRVPILANLLLFICSIYTGVLRLGKK